MSVLVDRFGRVHTYLRVSVTDRCNLRCRYCMPPQGIAVKPKNEILSLEEINRLCGIFVQLGITKVRITGGEPLVRQGIDNVFRHLHQLPGLRTLALTTNGVLLYDQVAMLKQCGLHAINISIDSLQAHRFEQITLRPVFDQVMRSIEKVIEVGFPSIKLNVVVMAGYNDDELLDFVDFVKDTPANVRFIEFMPFPDNSWQVGGVVSYARMRSIIEEKFVLSPIPGQPGDVAKDFALSGHQGTVSFITSMTDSFCSSCNRLRLTSDGSLKTCLFYAPELSLRDLLRTGAGDEQIAEAILDAVRGKPEAHPPMEELAGISNRSMVEIGG